MGRAVVALALACVVPLTGCQGPGRASADEATGAVRAAAENLRSDLQAVSGEPAAGGARPLAERVGAVQPAGPDVVVGTPVETADGVRVKVAFFAKGESGGGLWYSATAVRLCVEYAVHAALARAVVADVACGSEVPTSTGNVGTVDRTVELAD